MPRLPALDTKTHANDSPHVVILGAGASLAALPDGDRHGRRLPLMNTLVDTLDLRHDLDRAGVDLSSGNFEVIYDALAADPLAAPVRSELEERVRDYFGAMALPDRATLYDALLLSLRGKDAVATFNWDPLLVQAYRRVADLGPVPHVLFLHGNVAVGYCARDRVSGNAGGRCGTCGERLVPSPLLFPVRDKNYRADPFLANQWDTLEEFLSGAFILTIFGYSAPASDAAARALMHRAWGANESRELAEVEIVDIRPRDEVAANWRDFTVRQHYGIAERFEQTLSFRHPRRSCDALAGAILQLDPWAETPLGNHETIAELRAAVAPLIAEERLLASERRPFTRGGGDGGSSYRNQA